MTTGDQVTPLAGDLDRVVRDALRLRHPETWNAVIARASKQANAFPDGMSNASEPAYCYCPGEDEDRPS